MTALAEIGGSEQAGTSGLGRDASLALLGGVAAMQLINVFRREANWDEFNFLSLIFEHRRGELTQALQTFHVHLFSWLTALPTDELGMIVAGRALMWALHLATLWFLYRTARALVSGPGALWAVTAYATVLYVVQHATSFRADPMITALSMGALFALTRERLGLATLTLAGLAVALAGLISIKSVFFLPIIAALGCLRIARATQRARLLRDMAAALVVAAAAFAGALSWHMAALGQSGPSLAAGVARASDKQFLDREFLFAGAHLVRSLITSPVQWAAFVAGTLIALRAGIRARGAERMHAITLAAFASPLLLVAFYRNSFPYFYVFMLAPVAVLAALSLDAGFLRRRARRLAVFCAALAAVQFAAQWHRDNEGQRALIAAVHELFPEPVPYLDRAGMISSYPRAGFLMSGWGIDSYRLAGRPIISQAIAKQKPRFVIVSGYPLVAALEGGIPEIPESMLLDADAAALRENYVRHWGPLWVAGKTLPPTGGTERAFRLQIPGDYTIEAQGPVEIDGRAVRPGETVELTAGEHGFAGEGAVLRYGRNLPVPSSDPPDQVFTGF